MNSINRRVQFFPVYGLLVCQLFYSITLHAADAEPSEQAFLQDFPVVLSASRLLQPQSEAPNAVTVIDRNMIRASGFRTIGDVFRLVPGMYVGNLNGYSPVVSYHGSTEEFSRRMQVLVDGRSVYLPPLSTVDWEDIPLHIADIERIEVVRGPAAASYGANSLQGVINIITRDATALNGFRGSVKAGDFGVADVAAHFGQSGETVDYRMTLAHREDNGYGSASMYDARRTDQANLRANYHPAGSGSLDVQLGYSYSTRGLGVVGKTDEVFRNVVGVSSFQQLTWLNPMQGGDELKLHYYHISRQVLDPAYYSLNAGGQAVTLTAAERHDVELQHTTHWSKDNRLVWGAGTRADYAANLEIFDSAYTIRQSRVFAHNEWRFTQSALLNAGTMLEDDGFGHINSSPRVALNYHVLPQHTLRAGVSVAYRTPAIYEEKVNVPVTYGYVSQGGLRPEKTESREIGYLGEFNAAGITLDVRAYNDKISDVIFVDPAATIDGWPFGFANLFAANYHGYEGTLKYRWSDSGNVTLNYSRQFVKCEITGTATNPFFVPLYLQGYMDDCPLSVPDFSGSILFSQQLAQQYEVSAGYYHMGGLKMIAATPQSMMNRVDLRVARRFGKSGQPGSGEVSLVAQNVFQDDYTKYSVTIETNNMRYQSRLFAGASVNF